MNQVTKLLSLIVIVLSALSIWTATHGSERTGSETDIREWDFKTVGPRIFVLFSNAEQKILSSMTFSDRYHLPLSLLWPAQAFRRDVNQVRSATLTPRVNAETVEQLTQLAQQRGWHYRPGDQSHEFYDSKNATVDVRDLLPVALSACSFREGSLSAEVRYFAAAAANIATSALSSEPGRRRDISHLLQRLHLLDCAIRFAPYPINVYYTNRSLPLAGLGEIELALDDMRTAFRLSSNSVNRIHLNIKLRTAILGDVIHARFSSNHRHVIDRASDRIIELFLERGENPKSPDSLALWKRVFSIYRETLRLSEGIVPLEKSRRVEEILTNYSNN